MELASRYEADGADEIVFLDITASHEGRATLHETVRRTAEVLFIPLTVGGGVRTVDDVGALLRAGADKVSVNSALARRPELAAEAAARYGSQCLVASVDAAREGDRWRIYTHGGRLAKDLDAIEWAAECARRGRDSAHEHRPGRLPPGLRPGVDAPGGLGRVGACGGIGRRRIGGGRPRSVGVGRSLRGPLGRHSARRGHHRGGDQVRTRRAGDVPAMNRRESAAATRSRRKPPSRPRLREAPATRGPGETACSGRVRSARRDRAGGA